MVINIYSDFIFMIKVIQEIIIFKIQSSCDNTKNNEFVDLFTKKSTIINAKVPLKIYKKSIRGNKSQSKYKINILEAN